MGLAAALALPAFATEGAAPKSVHHHHVYRHLHRSTEPFGAAPNATAQAPTSAAPQSALQSWFSHVAPYPDGKGDEDGLSRDPTIATKGASANPDRQRRELQQSPDLSRRSPVRDSRLDPVGRDSAQRRGSRPEARRLRRRGRRRSFDGDGTDRSSRANANLGRTCRIRAEPPARRGPGLWRRRL